MIAELEQYEAQQKNQRNEAVQQMMRMMDKHYVGLKNEVNIDDQAGLEDEDYDLDNILNALKPNTTAKNFKEYLRKGDNCLKTLAWRQISRQVFTNDQK